MTKTSELQAINGFELNEKLGRDKFKSFIDSLKNNPRVEFTQDKFDKKDAWVYINNRVYAAEIKNRNPNYEKFDTYIMEKIKYDELERLYKEGKAYDCMMAYFFDDLLYLFNLKTIDELLQNNQIKIIYKKLPNSTVEHSYDLEKPCYLLPKKYAYKYKYNSENNNWKLIRSYGTTNKEGC